jgi:hypothetical protein
VGKPKGRRPLGRPRRRWWIILGWLLERWDGVMWTGLVWLRIGTGGEDCIMVRITIYVSKDWYRKN